MVYRFRDHINIQSDVKLGVEPPRADFLILTEDELIDFGLDVFKIFRKHNIIEFKSPKDALDMRVLYKTIGYGGIYISQAKHKGDIPPEQVTLSIFREAYPEQLFAELGDKVIPDHTKGIYHINSMVEIPLQIVVTKELEGDEYAEFRSISNTPNKTDVEKIITDAAGQKELYLRQQYKAYLRMLAKIDGELIKEMKRGDADMNSADSAWMEIFKPEIDAQNVDRVCRYVRDGQSSIEYAAKDLDMDESELLDAMRERGYSVPDSNMAMV